MDSTQLWILTLFKTGKSQIFQLEKSETVERKAMGYEPVQKLRWNRPYSTYKIVP